MILCLDLDLCVCVCVCTCDHAWHTESHHQSYCHHLGHYQSAQGSSQVDQIQWPQRSFKKKKKKKEKIEQTLIKMVTQDARHFHVIYLTQVSPHSRKAYGNLVRAI